uniref:Auxin efflux carrier n=1 Tax=Zooxanthella nutricula TaxID=1333877 RepID=A0A7S2JEN8_9DINO
MSQAALLVATLTALATAAVMALAGVAATRRGMITDGGRRCLAELTLNIFVPALLFTSVVRCPAEEACAPIGEMIGEAWFLLPFPLVVVGFGIILGRLVCWGTGCPASFRRGCVGAVAFANSTGMPITLLGVLGPVLREAGVLQTDPLRFQPVYLILYPVLQWSFGSYLFGLSGASRTPSQAPSAAPAAIAERPEDAPAAAPAALAEASASESAAAATTQGVDLEEASFGPAAPRELARAAMRPQPSLKDRTASMPANFFRRSSTMFPSLPSAFFQDMASQACSLIHPADLDLATEPDMAPLDVARTLKSDASPLKGATADLEQCCSGGASAVPVACAHANPSARSSEASIGSSESGRASVSPSPSHCWTLMTRFLAAARRLVKQAIVPPVVGAVLGVAVAAWPPLRALFVDIDAAGKRPPLEFAFLAMSAIGRASVPINMLVLGSNLSKGANLRAIPGRTNLGIIATKQLVMPAITLVLIHLLSYAVPMAEDPSIALVMIIMSCTPTSNNLMIMVELSGQNKEAMTACIFAQYVAAPFFMTLVVTGSLMLLQTPGFFVA